MSDEKFLDVSDAALLQLQAYNLEVSGDKKNIHMINELLSKAADILVDVSPRDHLHAE
tara:strand:+ start:88442 stop:88615 length:174 start_codon:yes stop_codon:yes gene_type:complete